ncbi:hypothetical protein J3458_005138 [Metarhizium acridum]|nr:hypothetical protein J3458_005138 [Metarhizium acridum]
MKSAVATLGMLAAVASAYTPGRHHLHFPRANTTSADSLTTVTVKTTQVHTITSCAPTVTNCPAHPTDIATLPESQKTTATVTDTIVLTEIVCPVSEVGKVSSSVIHKASTGGLTGSTLSPTTKASPAPSTLPANATSARPVVSSKIVTLTLGTGTSASVVTSTILVTGSKPVAPPSEATAEPTDVHTRVPIGSDQQTTLTSTTKVTRTVTVSRTHPTTPSGGNHGGDSTCAPSTVTVTVAKETVTLPASTVYVTIGGPTTTDAGKPKPSSIAGDKDKTSSDCTDETTTLQKTVTVVPFPTGNGTHTSGSSKPSGYARLR